ncbi:MAG: hypothetical protein ACPG5T_09475, partial [Endozoicomonas sp.]
IYCISGWQIIQEFPEDFEEVLNSNITSRRSWVLELCSAPEVVIGQEAEDRTFVKNGGEQSGKVLGRGEAV